MAIHPIRNETDYERALSRLAIIFHAPLGSPESDEADVLTTLIADYEDTHHRVAPPDPIEAIRIRMEDQGLTRADLKTAIGSKGRVSEILNKRRPLTIAMVHALSELLGLSAQTLVQPYELRPYGNDRPTAAMPSRTVNG
jgi:HTH-type transcriptional regulator/antitoxin HigA